MLGSTKMLASTVQNIILVITEW